MESSKTPEATSTETPSSSLAEEQLRNITCLTSDDPEDYIEKTLFLETAKTYRRFAARKWMGFDGFPGEDEILEIVKGSIIYESESIKNKVIIILGEKFVADVVLSRMYSISLNMACDDDELREKILISFEELIAKYKSTDVAKVPITFSFYDRDGANYYSRSITCPEWEEVKENYQNARAIEDLMNMRQPDERGKLIFWHGVPGTGKTYAIRALMQSWRKKANFLYVLDPEAFFNKPAYMLQTIMRECEDGITHNSSRRWGRYIPIESDEKESPVTILVVEDGLDILLRENRRSMSASMGRLLNLTEGIIGQGFRIIVMMTTNEEISEIDPAFLRHGRCLQTLQFNPFRPSEAERWASAHGFTLPNAREGEYTLADLYALKNDVARDVKPIPEPVSVQGFK
jgi:hypothetical protein